MNSLLVREIADREVELALDLLAMLNGEVGRDELAKRLARIRAEHPHYELYGVYEGEVLLGLAGVWTATKMWCGRYLEVDNLVVAAGARGRGVGTALLEFLEVLAEKRGCEILVLDSYTANTASHRLYHRLGYEIKGFHFVKRIADTPAALSMA